MWTRRIWKTKTWKAYSTTASPSACPSATSSGRLVKVDGTYDRGFTKVNKKEAEALVQEVIRRLKDPALSRQSMGVVTFSSAQRTAVEKLLTKEIAAKKLDAVAYEREEPLFVKNLENVQGDERDVILFSVCYGPDAMGRVSLNFGPLNQAGGWRRLNVAVSRAREEMLVFSTLEAAQIDLNKTSSKGVAGLKAFLEFAEKGKTTLAAPPASVRSGPRSFPASAMSAARTWALPNSRSTSPSSTRATTRISSSLFCATGRRSSPSRTGTFCRCSP